MARLRPENYIHAQHAHQLMPITCGDGIVFSMWRGNFAADGDRQKEAVTFLKKINQKTF
jgi:hypothetical protein